MKYISLIVILLNSFLLSAQELSIKSFAADPTDLTASLKRRNDANGDACALVQVQLAHSGAKFSGNVVGQVTYDTSIYYVYMLKGSKRLDIQLEGYLPLSVIFSNYVIEGLEPLTTYKLLIDLQTEEEKTFQKLIVDYKPTEALFVLDGQLISSTNGHIEKDDIPTGDHRYILLQQGYVSDEGTFSLKENAPKRLNLQLYAEEKQNSTTENVDELLRKAESSFEAKDYVDAKNLFMHAFELDPQNYESADWIGWINYNGFGMEFADYEAAEKWYRIAAEGGNSGGQNHLGGLYNLGIVVEKNLQEAVSWYRKSAESGNPGGQYNLAKMYEEGRGVDKDLKQAKYWYKKAAKQGHEEAEGELVAMEYRNQSWYKKAVKQYGVEYAERELVKIIVKKYLK